LVKCGAEKHMNKYAWSVKVIMGRGEAISTKTEL
jgi:hypothetical protein